ncbi:hypothetical protein CMV_018342 [Castanea mollissima]|uniref:Uncharacterized protein n=1 Tax=Castanea mollissima TaxID=60419 RepID=A0A8J4QPL5_9ROSI|nr:hypothetical protein CMV_018342 [Castanea mollissima]
MKTLDANPSPWSPLPSESISFRQRKKVADDAAVEVSVPERTTIPSDDDSAWADVSPLLESACKGASVGLLLLWTRRVVEKFDGAVGNYSIYRAETLGIAEFPILGCIRNSRVGVKDTIISSRVLRSI